ncbi:hypothetical protein ACTA71_001243 [Dictyostelium dimigraforme]
MKCILKDINEKRNVLEIIKKKGEFKQLERFENEIKIGKSIMITDDLDDPNIILSFAINDGVFRVYVNNKFQPIKEFLECFNWSSGFLNNKIFKQFLKNGNCNLNRNENSINYHLQSLIDIIDFNELDERVRLILKNILESQGFANVDIGGGPGYVEYLEYTLSNNETCYNIYKLWKYKTKFTMDEIIWSIKNGFSWCYKVNDGNFVGLVSWVIGFSDGRITQFTTLPEFRGKGYGTKVVSKLMVSFLEKEINPLAYISGDNYASQSLFTKLCFNRSVEVFSLSALK